MSNLCYLFIYCFFKQKYLQGQTSNSTMPTRTSGTTFFTDTTDVSFTYFFIELIVYYLFKVPRDIFRSSRIQQASFSSKYMLTSLKIHRLIAENNGTIYKKNKRDFNTLIQMISYL